MTVGCPGAVVEGFRRARGDWLAVMDADLQHPPEVLADLFATGQSAGADIVCATRNVQRRRPRRPGRRSGRHLQELHHLRPAGVPAAPPRGERPDERLLPGAPDAFDPEALHPTGFKILLEILVRTPGLRRAEVSYEFATRFAGDSKASLKEGVVYLRHLARLRLAA